MNPANKTPSCPEPGIGGLCDRAAEIADELLAKMPPPDPGKLGQVISARDVALFRRATKRFEALCALDRLVAGGFSFDASARHVRRQHGVGETSLYRWFEQVQRLGLAGLLQDRRKGNSGRKRKGAS